MYYNTIGWQWVVVIRNFLSRKTSDDAKDLLGWFADYCKNFMYECIICISWTV